MRPLNISVIITTYNRPDSLALVLHALAAQTRQAFEIIIADDGSQPETRDMIQHIQGDIPCRITHVWQSDKGFRAAKIRNKAVAKSHGSYLIFLDGDCIPLPNFIEKHSQLAEKQRFISGNRVLCHQDFTAQIIRYQLPIWTWSRTHWFMQYLKGHINRVLPLFTLPSILRDMLNRQRWQGAKTCNLALWREDFMSVNGFEEQFTGWGHEDAEFVVRLLRAQVHRKTGRFAVPVFHLWHSENDRSQEQENRQRLQDVLDAQHHHAQQGIQQYL